MGNALQNALNISLKKSVKAIVLVGWTMKILDAQTPQNYLPLN